MNDDFENRLQSLRPRALPEAWRTEILAQAAGRRSRTRPPRWLVGGWSVAWAAIIMLYLTTPTGPAPQMMAREPAPMPILNERTRALDALLASNLDSTPLHP